MWSYLISINSLSNHYEDLTGPRLRALQKPMEKISELQLGKKNTKMESKKWMNYQ